jgi:uncharacterized protein (TIGR02453 family)
VVKTYKREARMAHFGDEYLKFFKGLAKNNSKEWFDKNRATYNQYVKTPFYAFVEEMIVRIHADNPDVLINASEAIFRINRDIRFSKDKTPYKTHLSAFISPGGKKAKDEPGFYFQLGVDGIRIYSGIHLPDKENLEKLRRAISNNPDEFAKIIKDKKFVSKYDKVLGEQHKRIPPEFKDAFQKQPLIANKDFYVMANLESSYLTKDKLSEILMEY